MHGITVRVEVVAGAGKKDYLFENSDQNLESRFSDHQAVINAV